MNTVYSQRDNYKLVEKLLSGEFTDEISVLKSLVKDIVDQKNFEITGGRIWELDTDGKSYFLRFQFGSLDKIPENYRILISEQPLLAKLIGQRVILTKETDTILQEKGIELYSMSGVGNIIKLKTGSFYKYLLGFNAPEIKPTFAETLAVISSMATITLRKLSVMVQSEKIKQDLTRAAEIQRSLLPEHHTRFHDYDIFGVCTPDAEVGGDYFDYIRNSDKEDERLGIVISDAASKGLPAAIQSLFVSGALRMGMSYSMRIADLFGRMNKLIFDTFPYERFVTMFYCELTLASNRLVLFANAGHCAPIHYYKDTGGLDFLGPTGGLLGILETQRFHVENFRMHPGDVLVLYTDGITEAMNKERELFGEKRLSDLIKQYHGNKPEHIAYHILEEVQKFTADSSYTDDRTLVIIKRDDKK